MTVDIYTDGSCNPNPGQASFAAILYSGERQKRLSGHLGIATNNYAELYAIFAGLRAIKKGCSVQVFCDSQYAINCVASWYRKWEQNGWKTRSGKPVLNVDVIRDILAEIRRIERLGGRVSFRWIRSHTELPTVQARRNEQAHELAEQARLKQVMVS